LPEAVHGGVDAVLEFDDGAVGPEFAADFFTGHEVAGPVEEHGEDSKGLFGQGDSFLSLAAQLACAKVKLKAFETGYLLGPFDPFQNAPLNFINCSTD
jgi:hypothetical protein